jgi:DNA-binding NtrC family response regulator
LPAVPIAAPPSARILIVDDEAIIRESISTYLEDSGFSVMTASDGLEGLNHFRSEMPDVVLLDLRMPKVDGLEVLAAVMAESPETPVIVITGAGVLQDAVAALRLGAFDFITKPIIDMVVLEHAVRKAFERVQLQNENRRYRQHLEEEIHLRTADLIQRSAQLLIANETLKKEIAERERTATALSQSEAKLTEIISIFEGFIYSCTSDCRLIFANQKLVDHIGKDVIGELCHEVLYGLDKSCAWCARAEVLSGKTARCEFFNEKDGRFYYAIQSPVLEPDGKVGKIQAILIDITERRLAEETLRRREIELKEKNRRLKTSLRGSTGFGPIIGRSKPMQKVYEAILRAAESAACVIIYGDSGTGKELVAKTIHDLSDRGAKNFVTVNCGAIPDNLIESEFFGYKKGAFTGADIDKPGYLDAADGGTLFMDEIGELNLSMQVKLLRAIEGGGYTPIGGNAAKHADFRIIAATNRDLRRSLENGHFRKDFYYRIHILPIYLPPLSARKEDIGLLIHHFLQLFSHDERVLTIPQNMISALQAYHWPGNVRELQNAIHRYLTLKKIDFMEALPTPASPLVPEKELSAGSDDQELCLADFMKVYEKKYIHRLLQQNQWHRSRVAAILGIDRRTLFRKIKEHGL